MQILLLTVDVLVLAVLTYLIYRLVSAARRRAEESRSPASNKQTDRQTDQQISLNLAAGSEAVKTAAPPKSSNLWEERLPDAVAAPIILGTVSSTLVHPAIEEDLPYADPVDGMPFEPGEFVVPCICGLAYRDDSVKWLEDYHAGCCIHCGAKVNLPEPRC